MNDEIKETLDKLNYLVKNEMSWWENYTVFSPKDTKQLLDYITNLQQKEELFEKIVYKYDELKQENERLKEKSINEVLKNDFDMCVKDLKKANKKIEKLEDYKSRCEKAVEYIMSELVDEWSIKNDGHVHGSDLPVDAITPILDILNGRSDE